MWWSIFAGLQRQRRVVHTVVVFLVRRRRVFRVVRGDLVFHHVTGDFGRVKQRRVGLHQRLQIRVQKRFVVIRRYVLIAAPAPATAAALVFGELQKRRQRAAAAAAARVIVNQVHGRGKFALQLAGAVPQLIVVSVRRVARAVDRQVFGIVATAHATVGRLQV